MVVAVAACVDVAVVAAAVGVAAADTVGSRAVSDDILVIFAGTAVVGLRKVRCHQGPRMEGLQT